MRLMWISCSRNLIVLGNIWFRSSSSEQNIYIVFIFYRGSNIEMFSSNLRNGSIHHWCWSLFRVFLPLEIEFPLICFEIVCLISFFIVSNNKHGICSWRKDLIAYLSLMYEYLDQGTSTFWIWIYARTCFKASYDFV